MCLFVCVCLLVVPGCNFIKPISSLKNRRYISAYHRARFAGRVDGGLQSSQGSTFPVVQVQDVADNCQGSD